MPTLLLVAPHFFAFVAGLVMCRAFTLYQGRMVLHPTLKKVVPTMPRRMPRLAPKSLAALAIMPILAGAVLVGIGIQSSRFQDAQVDRDACVTEWGRQLVDTVTTRTKASQRLEKAEARRSSAIDSIVITVIALREDPPEADEKDATAVLLEFAAAKAERDKVARRVGKTRDDNQYPALNCQE